jgi:pyrroline-5-carboxylate reductase
MKYDISFIGAGNMGSALLAAAAKTGKNIAVYDIDADKARALAEKHGAAFASDEEIAWNSRIVFLAVKPHIIEGVCRALRELFSPDTLLVTMAAGKPLAAITAAAGTEKVIRIMPNTPAAVGKGLTVYCRAAGVTAEDEALFLEAMACAGRTDPIEERLIDAAMALSGCGPAFVYQFAEALADGAVACGLPREKANLYAAQTLAGAAAMLLESGAHPGELKDAVCSPGGTTIAGVLALEDRGFRGAVSAAVAAAFNKTKGL